MQFDVLRAFPYPVLRPHVDDYVDGQIQTTVHVHQLTIDSDVVADVEVALSVPELTELIEAGLAKYVVVFACRDTFLRKAVMNSRPSFSYAFSAGTLRGEVVMSPYVVAVADIPAFSCSWINAEFGTGPFHFRKGAVLAVDEPQTIYVDRESFRPISSSFVLVKSESLSGYEWRVEAESDKVRIAASPGLKERIDSARNSTPNQALLINSIYFAAVMQCLSLLRASDDYDQFRWAGVFRQRCADLDLEIDAEDESRIAQRLMKYPFALVDTYFLSNGGEL